jgi:ribose transport system substrate-binding protein
MPSRKLTFALVAGLMLSSSLSAIAADTTIGFIRGINASPVFSMMECGVRKAALERGAKLIVDGPSEWNINVQLPIIRAMIAKKPAFIVFDPNDDTAAVGPIKEAEALGTKIVLVDNAVTGVNVPYLGMDDVEAGEVAGQALAKAMGGEGKVLLVGTYAANYVPQLRMKGYMAALTKYPKITVLEKQYAENSASKTSQIINATLAVAPDLKGLIADGDIVGEFAGATLANLNRTDIHAFAFDATPAEQKWLQRKALEGLVAWDPYSLGYEGAKVGFDLLDGKEVPKNFSRQPYVLVTRENMNQPGMSNYLYTDDCQPKG